jgi:flagellar P-ring protein precursor FlgI
MSKKEKIVFNFVAKSKIKLLLISIIMAVSFNASYARATVRIKDIVRVEGVRDNLLIGYGLVVGLNGTGDNLGNSAFTQKGLVDFLERLGVNTRGANLKTKNIAAVTITASLPPFTRQGNKIDISVSTLGDAKSLQGGTLLATPLLGADGEVYAVAQGQVSLGGFSA